MVNHLQQSLTEHLKKVIQEYDALGQRAQYDDLSDLPEEEISRIRMRGIHAVERASGNRSVFAAQVSDIRRFIAVFRFV
jgi:hypothetical protein